MLLIPSAIISSVFNPSSVPGLDGWWRADVGVYSDSGITPSATNGPVQQWNDSSGNGKHAVQLTGVRQPTFVTLAGNPAIKFVHSSGTNLQSGGSSDFAAGAFTVYVVCARPVIQQNSIAQTMLYKGDATNAATVMWGLTLNPLNGPKMLFETFTAGPTNHVGSDTSAQGLTDLITAKRVDNLHKVLYRNGYQVATDSDGGANMQSGATPLVFGSDAGNIIPGDVCLREVLYYSAAHSDSDRNRVEHYLRSKWRLPAGPWNIITAGYNNGYPGQDFALFQSMDFGSRLWYTPQGVTNPVGTFRMVNNSTGTIDTEQGDLLFYNGVYWLLYEQIGNVSFVSASQTTLGLMTASNLAGPWTWVIDIVMIPNPAGAIQTVWDPRWFLDDDGSVYAMAAVGNNLGSVEQQLFPTLVKAMNPGTFTSWGTPFQLTGSGIPSPRSLDCTLISPGNSPNGKYNYFYKDELVTNKIGYASSSSLASGYTMTADPVSDIFNLGAVEGFHLYKHIDGWRAYCSGNGSAPPRFSDSLDNWATWAAGTGSGGAFSPGSEVTTDDTAFNTNPGTEGVGGFRMIAYAGPPNNIT